MVRSSKEKVLLYQFRDASLLAQVQQIMHELQISVQLLPEDAWVQKIGYLLGLRGFHQQELSDDGFVFPHEVMLLHNIKNKRLDQVLRELQPVLKTLNEKSNALVFEAKDKKDPEPKRAK